jgi:phosphatidylinositol alpha-mannosyltransferase
VCLPAIGGESFGIALVEAMAAGRPIVASAIPGFAAVARAGIDAVLVPPGDPGALAEGLAGLLGDAEQAVAQGRSARQAASRFDWRHVTTEIEAVYAGAMGSG